jgi:hypothetical protein
METRHKKDWFNHLPRQIVCSPTNSLLALYLGHPELFGSSEVRKRTTTTQVDIEASLIRSSALKGSSKSHRNRVLVIGLGPTPTPTPTHAVVADDDDVKYVPFLFRFIFPHLFAL